MANAKTQMGVVAVLGIVAAGVFALLLRGGCNNGPPQPTPTVAHESGPTPHAVDLDVFIDGSGSIRNFLQRTGADTRPNFLKALLNGFEDTLAPGGDWQNLTPHFFLFGERVVPSPNTPAFLSEHPDAFHMGTTHIEAAIDYQGKANPAPDPPAKLKIIVTDLYEDQGETHRVANALAAFLQPGPDGKPAGAIGVLGIRNPFSGAVEDLSSVAPGKLPNAADSMPFYILLAGAPGDVRHGMKALLGVPALHTAAASGEVLQLLFARDPQPRAGTQPTIAPKTYSLRESRDGIESIALSGDPVQATWKDPPAAEGNTVALGKNADSHIAVLPATGADAAGPCDPAQPLCLKIDPRRFPRPGTYLFHLDLEQTEPNDALLPASDTLAHWNIERDDADRLAQGPKVFPRKASLTGQHPGLTPGLSELLRALQAQMFRSPVPYASYDLYVEAK